MKDLDHRELNANTGLHGQVPALQVICLGSSGGPCEENVTGFLVRAVASGWSRGSLLAVDAGSHMAPIVRILEHDFPVISPVYGRTAVTDPGSAVQSFSDPTRPSNGPSHSRASSVDSDLPPKPPATILETGPFAGFSFPNRSARANALHLLRSYISTYLITHPHLDHLSGFVINTAAFHATSRPKTLAALPETVDAVKKHIFNDVIWPNLTDEDGGVGFVTFQRLKEGGDVMLGDGEGRGYIDVCDGLGVKAFKVSHGLCTKSPPSHFHRGSLTGLENLPLHNGESMSQGRSLSTSQQQQQHYSAPGTPIGNTPRPSYFHSHPSPRTSVPDQIHCVVDSTMFFIRDSATAREVLIFGDVEPDSVSLSPRNHVVWQEAARKIAHNLLGGIFIESSYDNSQADAVLFGHLNPRHLIAELQTLALLVTEAKATRLAEKAARKRKRAGQNSMDGLHSAPHEGERHKRTRSLAVVDLLSQNRRSSVPDSNSRELPGPMAFLPDIQQEQISPMAQPHRHQPLPTHLALSPPATQTTFHKDLPLTGIKVIIIHIKDTMTDGPHVAETVLAELQAHEQQLRAEGQGLGCEFVIAQSGESYWF